MSEVLPARALDDALAAAGATPDLAADLARSIAAYHREMTGGSSKAPPVASAQAEARALQRWQGAVAHLGRAYADLSSASKTHLEVTWERSNPGLPALWEMLSRVSDLPVRTTPPAPGRRGPKPNPAMLHLLDRLALNLVDHGVRITIYDHGRAATLLRAAVAACTGERISDGAPIRRMLRSIQRRATIFRGADRN